MSEAFSEARKEVDRAVETAVGRQAEALTAGDVPEDDDDTVFDASSDEPDVPSHPDSGLPVRRITRRKREVTEATRRALMIGIADPARAASYKRTDGSSDDNLSSEQRAERNAVINGLELAAIALRDSDLAVRAAQKRYAEALQAFNQFVAPVV